VENLVVLYHRALKRREACWVGEFEGELIMWMMGYMDNYMEVITLEEYLFCYSLETYESNPDRHNAFSLPCGAYPPESLDNG